jgi:hypothetical protein
MSRQWTRATVDTGCGKCDKRIGLGQPMITITARPPYSGSFVRCADCAGEPAPADVPMYRPVDRSIVLGAVPATARRAVLGGVEDYSWRRLGERDPGEEDL